MRDCVGLSAMKVGVLMVSIVTLWCVGCASAPTVASSPAPPPASVQDWPVSVADTCPRRAVSVECFRRESIDAAMRSLGQKYRACYRPGGVPIKVMLTVETRGGTPSCVQRSPRSDAGALCLATGVAQHLRIPKSPADERCRFRYPLRIE